MPKSVSDSVPRLAGPGGECDRVGGKDGQRDQSGAIARKQRADLHSAPMQFLADCRLRLAREALRTARPDDTVSSVAYACGFSHPGRFAEAYRKSFGESPSETLRKA